MLLHDIIHDWLIFYIYHSALNSTLHIACANWLSSEWVNNATYLSRICLNLNEGLLKFLCKKGNWNVILFRSVFNTDQIDIVIINLLTCCVCSLACMNMALVQIVLSGQMSIFCLNWLQVFLAYSTKGQRTEWNWNVCFPLTLSLGVFSRKNIPFPLSVLYN